MNKGKLMVDQVKNVVETQPGYGSRLNLVFAGLEPSPEDEWDRLRDFLGLGEPDVEAMLQTVEPLFRRGYELVVANYDYLLRNHETAAILGWDQGADPEHLAERRRFFTVWLARTLGLDFSHDFAYYLFRAGQKHAGHGPRRTHVTEVYVTGAVSLVNNSFARFLAEEMPGSPVVPLALAGWNKYLSMHLHMMLTGYHSAVALDRGRFPVEAAFYGRLRALLGTKQLTLHAARGERVGDALRAILNYYPQLRDQVFEVQWLESERLDTTGTPWMTVEKSYVLKPAGWRLLLNGRGIEFSGGLEVELSPGDELSIFPPTR